MTTSSTLSTKDYLASHAVFTGREFASALPPESSDNAAKHRLDNAVRRGWVERVTRGVYVSRVGLFAESMPDALLLASKLAPDATISHASALVAHGVSHNVLRRVTFLSTQVPARFSYRGYEFVRLPLPDRLNTPEVRDRFTTQQRVDGALVRLTTRERTLVDCLAQPKWSGGLEALLRSVGGVPSWRLDDLVAYLDVFASPTVTARTAWVLTAQPDLWHLSDDDKTPFRNRLGVGPYYLGDRKRDMRFVSEWRLYVPSDAEPQEWLNG